MDFDQLQAKGVLPSEKLIALKLHGLSWFDRRWLLKKLPTQTRAIVKKELAQLKQIGVTNAAELLAQLTHSQVQKNAPGSMTTGIGDYGFSDALGHQLSLLMSVQTDSGQVMLRQTIAQYMKQTDGSHQS